MASLFPTKYANNIRTVSGLGVFVFPDDVTLNCNTSLGAVSIDLLEIPANFWSTTYKLYVNDANNNASVNNITINAPAGYTINNAASIVINTNGGGVLIRVTDNTTYMATANSTGGIGGGYNTIQDEGVALPQRTIINFIGAGVTASDVGGKTQVDIIGGIIDITEAAISTLISSNTIRLGQYYRITDVTNADLGVVVQGVRVNGITAYGTGIFLNADYQAVGDYSGVPSYVGNIGIWSPVARPVVVGNVVVYNNLNFVNLTGVWGTAPNTDLANWSVITKSVTTGYILACDFVKYDIIANRVVYRADKLDNEVDYFVDSKGNEAITNFQWGRNLVQWNKVLANGIMLCRNSSVTFVGNIVNTGGIIIDDSGFTFNGIVNSNTVTCFSQLETDNNSGEVSTNTLVGSSTLGVENLSTKSTIKDNFISNNSKVSITSIGTNGLYYENTLQNFSIFDCSTIISGSVFRTILSNYGRLNITSIAASISISFCNVLDDIDVDLGIVTSSYANYEYRIGFSNWEANLDFSDPTIFAVTTLTIPLTLAYVGKFNTINTSTPTITDIVNLPTNHPVELIPALGNDFTLQYTAVGIVAGNEIIRAFAATSDTFTGSSLGRSEFVVLSKNVGINRVLNKYIWQ
jgi:hypothetical protein